MGRKKIYKLKYLYITDDNRTFEDIPEEYLLKYPTITLENIDYTTPEMLEEYMDFQVLVRKFWFYSKNGIEIKYTILNPTCSLIKNESRRRINIQKIECFARHRKDYTYTVDKERYDKKKENCKILVEIIKEKEEEIKELEEEVNNNIDIDRVIEDKIRQKINSVVIQPRISHEVKQVNNQSLIDNMRINLLKQSGIYNNNNPYAGVRF